MSTEVKATDGLRNCMKYYFDTRSNPIQHEDIIRMCDSIDKQFDDLTEKCEDQAYDMYGARWEIGDKLSVSINDSPITGKSIFGASVVSLQKFDKRWEV